MGAIVKHFSLLRPSTRPVALSQKACSYLQRMAGFCSTVLGAYAAFTYPGCQGSEQHPYLPLTPQAPLDLLDPMAQVTQQLSQQPGPVAEPSLVLAPIQQQFFGSLVKWAGVTHSNEEHVSFLGVRRVRFNNSSFTLEGIS